MMSSGRELCDEKRGCEGRFYRGVGLRKGGDWKLIDTLVLNHSCYSFIK